MGTRQFSKFHSATLIALAIGCVVCAPVFSQGISQLVEIAVDESAGEVTKIRFDLDQMTSWSSYRSADGALIVELEDTVASSFVEVPPIAGGIISGLEIESDPDGPVTRVRILDGDTEHEIVPYGNSLEMSVRSLGTIASSDSQEALDDETVEPEGELEQAEELVAQSAAVQPLGTAEAPFDVAASTVVAGSEVVAVETATDSGNVSVYIRGDGSFAYSAFSLDGPDRFVIDLKDAVVGVEDRAIGVDESSVKQVRLAQYQDAPEPVTRVVFDLWTPAVPWVESVADGLVIRFGSEPMVEVAQADIEMVDDEGEGAAVLDEAPLGMAEEAIEELEVAEAVAAVGEIAEDSAEDLEAQAMEATEDADEAVDDAESAMAQVAEEPEVDAPMAEEPAVEWMDEAEMAAEESDVVEEEVYAEDIVPQPMVEEPEVTTVDVAPMPEMVAEPVAAASEAAYYNQQDLTVTTGEATGDPNPATGFERQQVSGGGRQFTGEPIDLSLQDSDVRDVLRSLAQLSGLNLVVQPGVSGRVTVEFVQVPWDQALEQILKINNLGYEVEGTIMRVAPLETFRREAEEKQRLARARAAAVPLDTVIQRVSYAKAGTVARILSARGGIMSERGSVVVDDRTNTLIIKELPAYVDTVLSVIENLDIPEPQVMIEARIIETTKRFSRTLGINWGFNGVASNEYGNTTGLEFPNNAQVEGGVSLLTGARNGFIDLSLGNVLNSFNLDIALQAAENEGLINVLSEPRISTLNNERATIQSGLQIPIQTVANNTVSVQFVNATLRLDVTPQVTADGTVLMDVRIQKREPQPAFAVAGASNAPIATKEASTRVIVRDGGTTVIGGIYEVASDQGEDSVPGLGKIKGIGNLFKNRRRNDENQELLIFITPRVIRL